MLRCASQEKNSSDKKETVQHLRAQIFSHINDRRLTSARSSCVWPVAEAVCLKRSGNLLAVSCLIRKIISTFSSILQLLAVCWIGGVFRQTPAADTESGVEHYLQSSTGPIPIATNTSFLPNWPMLETLPEMSLCDFAIFEVGNKMYQYTIQCHYNLHGTCKGIVSFFFLWNLLCISVGVLSTVRFALTAFLPSSKLNFVLWCLRCASTDYKLQDIGVREAETLVSRRLKSDGVLLLRQLAQTDTGLACDVVAADLDSLRQETSSEGASATGVELELRDVDKMSLI